MTRVVRVQLPAGLLTYRDGGRRKLVEEARCRMCLREAHVRLLTRHHVVKQAWFKRRTFVVDHGHGGYLIRRHEIRDCDAAIVPLCVPCHIEVERDEVARALLRKVLGAAEVALAVTLRGQDWFDGRYPARSESRSDRVVSAAI